MIRPTRAGTDGPGDELLAGPALAADQHGDVGVGDPLDHAQDLAHLLALAEQERLPVEALEVSGRRAVGNGPRASRGPVQRLAERRLQLVGLEGLAQEVGRAVSNRLDDGAGPSVPREHDDRNARVDRLEALERLHPTDAGQDHVERDHVRPCALEGGQGLLAGLDGLDLIAEPAGEDGQHLPDARVVVHDQQSA